MQHIRVYAFFVFFFSFSFFFITMFPLTRTNHACPGKCLVGMHKLHANSHTGPPRLRDTLLFCHGASCRVQKTDPTAVRAKRDKVKQSESKVRGERAVPRPSPSRRVGCLRLHRVTSLRPVWLQHAGENTRVNILSPEPPPKKRRKLRTRPGFPADTELRSGKEIRFPRKLHRLVSKSR